MVASQETLDKLEDIGLNMYERKIYAALLGRGVSTAGELSEMTNVPRSRAYDVLESLAEKGFVVIKSSKPMEYVSIPPNEAIENIKKQHQRDLDDKLSRLENFKDSEAVNELEQLYDQGVELVDPSEMSGSLKGSHQINQHMGTMFKEAESSIKMATTEKGLVDLVENHGDLLQDARENGVKIQVLAHVTDDNRDAYNKLSEFAEVRNMKHLQDRFDIPNGRFAIVDDNLTMSMTHDKVHQTQDTAFWTRSGHMSEETMEPVFDILWHHSDKPGDNKPKGPQD